MASVDDTDSLEDLLDRHKKEKKALQGQIQQLKHAVPKGDKKRKKEVTEQIAKLEADLDAKHTQEVAEFKSSTVTASESEEGVAEVTDRLAVVTTETTDETAENQQPVPKKPSKAQKRRDKKAQKEKNREEEIQQQEVQNLKGERHLEAQKLKSILSPLNLTVHEIHSDGNCLYNAVGHQLELRGLKEDNLSLRQKTAEYMRKHVDDYLPFLSKDSGDMYTPDEFGEYCHLLETTSAWGGQLELRALSEVLSVPIRVLQGVGPELVLGEQYHNPAILLLYYRHAYGLGEHYNSVRPRLPEDEEEEAGS